MKYLVLTFAFALFGCHNRLRVASPQISRAPELTCIVVVQTDKWSAELAQAALEACSNAMRREERRR